MNKAHGRMGGKMVLVTGGTSGIGKAAATALAAMGAEVIVTGRSREKGEKAAAQVRYDSGGRVDLALADLSSQEEVHRLAGEFRERYDRLDVLVNNAGLTQPERTETVDGLEATFATNHLAPFLLTNLLLDLLRGSTPSRVITTSSEARRWFNLDFGDLQAEKNYRAFPVYGKSKLANILFTQELADRLRGTGVTANCVSPGSVKTELGTNSRGPMHLLYRVLKPFMRSPEQGADTIVWLASSPGVEETTGKYFADRKEIPSAPDNRADRERLWEESERLTGLVVAP